MGPLHHWQFQAVTADSLQKAVQARWSVLFASSMSNVGGVGATCDDDTPRAAKLRRSGAKDLLMT